MGISGVVESFSPQPVLENKFQPRVKPRKMNHPGKTKYSKVPFIFLLIVGIAFLVGAFLFVSGNHIQKLKNNFTVHSNVKKLFSEILLRVERISPVSTDPISTSQPPINEARSTGVKAESLGNESRIEAKHDSTPPANRDDSQVSPGEASSIDQDASPSENGSPNAIYSDSISFLDAEPSSVKPTLGNIESSKPKNWIWKIVTVEEKECLLSLARRYYSKRMKQWSISLQWNPDQNVHLINRLQKIKLPEITEESLIIQQPDHTYKIHLGTFTNRIRMVGEKI
jgi:hypothetical protein